MLGRWRWCITGLPSGDLVLPVRLAQGAGQWTHLCHFLADPTVWHKIDLVRVRDRRAPGGWRFYAHLLVHQAGYEAPSTQARRTQIPTDRRAGVDANVSNLALASFPADRPEQLLIDQITCTAEQQLTAHKAARKARALDRVAAQYQLRPVRSLTTAAGPCGPPRRGRVVPQTGAQSGWAAACPC